MTNVTAPGGCTSSAPRAAGRAAGRSTLWPSRPDHRLGGDQGVDDRLLGRLHGGLEERVHPLVGQHRAACARPSALAASGLAVEKARKMSPEPLPDTAAGAGQAQRRAPGQPLQLVRQQRRVGGDDDDDRAGLALGPSTAAAVGLASVISRPTGTPAISSCVPQAEVGLHQHADGVAALLRRQHARRGADAALEARSRSCRCRRRRCPRRPARRARRRARRRRARSLTWKPLMSFSQPS